LHSTNNVVYNSQGEDGEGGGEKKRVKIYI